MPQLFGRKRKGDVPIDEYAVIFRSAVSYLLDQPADLPAGSEIGEEFMRNQTARWNNLRTITTTLESIRPDNPLRDVHKGLIGVLAATQRLINLCNMSIMTGLDGDAIGAKSWADKFEEVFPDAAVNAYYFQETLRHLENKYSSAYQTLGPTNELFQGLQERRYHFTAWLFTGPGRVVTKQLIHNLLGPS